MDKVDLERTKRVMEDLAFGKNPLTGEKLPNDTVLNDVSLARSFFLVSKIIDDLLKNEKQAKRTKIPQNVPRIQFHITDEQRERAISDEPIGITRFVTNVRKSINDNSMQMPTNSQILSWLSEKGLLYKVTDTDTGKFHRMPSTEGQFIGITAKEAEYNGKKYMGCFYSRNAQVFILENMNSILGNNTDA